MLRSLRARPSTHGVRQPPPKVHLKFQISFSIKKHAVALASSLIHDATGKLLSSSGSVLQITRKFGHPKHIPSCVVTSDLAEFGALANLKGTFYQSYSLSILRPVVICAEVSPPTCTSTCVTLPLPIRQDRLTANSCHVCYFSALVLFRTPFKIDANFYLSPTCVIRFFLATYSRNDFSFLWAARALDFLAGSCHQTFGRTVRCHVLILLSTLPGRVSKCGR